MTGDLLFGGGYGRVASTSSVFQLESRAKVGDTKNRRMLILRNSSAHELKTALSVMDVDAAGKQTTHLVYHSGNKPTASDVGALALDGSNRFSGDYTGNGSKTSRTVEAGASSELLAILSEIGMVLVGISGAICLDKRSGEVFGLDGVAFDHGMLSIWTDSEFVNGAQRSYWYQVL